MANPYQQDNLIGQSNALLEVLEHVSQIAPLSKPVLIIGERGTGKELIAERLHYLSQRWDQSFIKLNCSSLSENLLESELFGHESGAFTGARGVMKAASSAPTAAPCFSMSWPIRPASFRRSCCGS